MTIQRMDNVLIVVDDLEAAKSFFIELGLELEGETQVEGPSVDSLIGLKDVRASLALMRTPDGHGRIELDKFHTPNAIRFGPVDAPVNALGIRRIMFAVEDIDAVVARLLAHGAELIGEVVQFEDTYRLGIPAAEARKACCPRTRSAVASRRSSRTAGRDAPGHIAGSSLSLRGSWPRADDALTLDATRCENRRRCNALRDCRAEATRRRMRQFTRSPPARPTTQSTRPDRRQSRGVAATHHAVSGLTRHRPAGS